MAKLTQKIVPVVAATVIGASGLGVIKSFEGKENSTYTDIVGVPTVCYGHTGKYAIKGAKYSDEECESILLMDIKSHGEELDRCLVIKPNQNQRDAMLSLAFNIGGPRMCSSTLVRKWNAGDVEGAAREFKKWNRAGGKVVRGLTRRREAEEALFRSPVTVGSVTVFKTVYEAPGIWTAILPQEAITWEFELQ